MKILVTGSQGYIGSLLAPMLTQRGHEVIEVDTGFYRVGQLCEGAELTVKTLNKDIRHITAEDILGIEAVVHMAESNDLTGQLRHTITYDINHKGSVHLANIAKTVGVRRFVYTSSCNVYGVATDDYVTEDSPVNPQTASAICKTLVEQEVRAIADESFSPTFLRNANAFGASPRMRFDIFLNNLAGLAWTTKEIKITSDGTLWRPLVHVLDICKAIVCTLEAPRDVIHNQTFNVGNTTHNYQVKDIAKIVTEVFKCCQLSFGDSDSDNRSYRVSFEKINKTLPGFKCDWNVQRGTQQLFDLFSLVDMSKYTFLFRDFYRLNHLDYLIDTQNLSKDFPEASKLKEKNQRSHLPLSPPLSL